MQNNKQSSKKKEKKKNPTKCRANCASHKFTFKPKDQSQYHQQVSVNYCPQYCERSQKYENIYPAMNADDKNYYPLFGIDYDKDHYLTHEAKYKEEHERKVEDYVKKKKELLEPKPGRKTQWCAVCKTTYEDYLQHVNEPTHSNNCNQNQYIQKIIQLSKKFGEQRSQRLHQEESQHTIKEGNSNTPGDELETLGLLDNQKLFQQQQMQFNQQQQNLQQQQSSQQQQVFSQQPQFVPSAKGFQGQVYGNNYQYPQNYNQKQNNIYNDQDLTQFFYNKNNNNYPYLSNIQPQQQQQQQQSQQNQQQLNLINGQQQSQQVFTLPNQVQPCYIQPYSLQQQQNNQLQQQQQYQNQNPQLYQQQSLNLNNNNKKRSAQELINDNQEPIFKKQFSEGSKDLNQNDPNYYFKAQIMQNFDQINQQFQEAPFNNLINLQQQNQNL